MLLRLVDDVDVVDVVVDGDEVACVIGLIGLAIIFSSALLEIYIRMSRPTADAAADDSSRGSISRAAKEDCADGASA